MKLFKVLSIAIFGLLFSASPLLAAKNLVVSNSVTISPAATVYSGVTSVLSSSATESDKEHYLRLSGGTFSDLEINISANTLSVNGTLTFRVNGADSALTVAVTAGVTGRVYDSAHSASVGIGDRVNYKWVVGAGTGTATIKTAAMVFDADSNVSTYGVEFSNVNMASGAYIRPIVGQNSGSTPESYVQVPISSAGDFEEMEAVIGTNTSVTDTTSTLRINGADGANDLIFAALTSGRVQDTSAVDTVAAGDLVNYKYTGYTASSTVTALNQYISFTPDDATKFQHLASDGTATADGATRYRGISGRNLPETTESYALVTMHYDYTIENFYVEVTSNSTTASSTLDVRVDTGGGAASSSISISIGAGVSGISYDTANSLSGSAGDLVGTRIVNGGGGLIYAFTTAIEFQDDSPEAPESTGNFLLMF